MSVHIGEVESTVDVQPEPTGAPAAAPSHDADREARMLRERIARLRRDRARTCVEGYDD